MTNWQLILIVIIILILIIVIVAAFSCKKTPVTTTPSGTATSSVTTTSSSSAVPGTALSTSLVERKSVYYPPSSSSSSPRLPPSSSYPRPPPSSSPRPPPPSTYDRPQKDNKFGRDDRSGRHQGYNRSHGHDGHSSKFHPPTTVYHHPSSPPRRQHSPPRRQHSPPRRQHSPSRRHSPPRYPHTVREPHYFPVPVPYPQPYPQPYPEPVYIPQPVPSSQPYPEPSGSPYVIPNTATRCRSREADRMRQLWKQHVELTSLYIAYATYARSGILGDTEGTLKDLLRNQDELGENLDTVFVTKYGDEYARLLREHIKKAGEIVKSAQLYGSKDKTNELISEWKRNAKEIVDLLVKVNPEINPVTLMNHFDYHLNVTIDEVMDVINKRFSEANEKRTRLIDDAIKMANYIIDPSGYCSRT